MANYDSSTPPLPALAPELNESRTELLSRIQGLKLDLKNWRSKLDTQVKIYREELSELKKSLNVEVGQLRSEFQELRNTLQQQQEDVTTSLKNLGLQDSPGNAEEVQDPKVEEKDEEIHASTEEDIGCLPDSLSMKNYILKFPSRFWSLSILGNVVYD